MASLSSPDTPFQFQTSKAESIRTGNDPALLIPTYNHQAYQPHQPYQPYTPYTPYTPCLAHLPSPPHPPYPPHPSHPSHHHPHPHPRTVPSRAAAAAAPETERLKYNLIFRQQPQVVRACGHADRDRRLVDPPPILQLEIRDPTRELQHVVDRELRGEGGRVWMVHCGIWTPDERVDRSVYTEPSTTTSHRSQRMLIGSVAVAGFSGSDERGRPGLFFSFHDLSVRLPGRYKLRFQLVSIDMDRPPRFGSSGTVWRSLFSDPFESFLPKEFPGMRSSTALVMALRVQGCGIPLKQGQERKRNVRCRAVAPNAAAATSAAAAATTPSFRGRCRPPVCGENTLPPSDAGRCDREM